MPHLLPSIISRPTIQIRNTQQCLMNISHPTGQQTNLKMTIQNNKTDIYNNNNNKPAAVSNNTSPSKQAGKNEITYIQYKVQHWERKVLK